MKRAFSAVLLLAYCGGALAADPDAVLQPDSLGSIKLGMTARKLLNALHETLVYDYDPLSTHACGTASSKSNETIGVSFTLNEGYLIRININYNDKGMPSPIRTEAGIGLDASEDDVKKAYGDRIIVMRHPNDPSWHYFIVDDPSETYAIVFETNGTKVIHFRAGTYPDVVRPDGCT